MPRSILDQGNGVFTDREVNFQFVPETTSLSMLPVVFFPDCASLHVKLLSLA